MYKGMHKATVFQILDMIMQHFYGITAVKVLHTILKHKMTGYIK